jgi:hypothetical protein
MILNRQQKRIKKIRGSKENSETSMQAGKKRTINEEVS